MRIHPTSRASPGGLALALLVLVAPNAEARLSDAMWAAMEAATVRILCFKSPTEFDNGSGFVIGHGANSRHVVTNWHVVECSAAGGTVRVANGLTAFDLVAAQVRGHHEGHDLAVLETASALGRAPARLATAATVRKRDSVWAYGFPGAGEREGVHLADASVANGVVGRLLLDLPDRSTPRMIQHSAGINPGNSGGPLFDDFGRVIGVNTEKSLALVPIVSGQNPDGSPQLSFDRVPLGEGIGWSVISDELIELLDRLRIPHQVTTSRPSTLATFWQREPFLVITLGVLLLLSAMALTLVMTPRGRAIVRERMTEPLTRIRDQHLPRPPHPAPMPSHPRLRGLAGPYAGTELPLEETPIAIGRDPKLSQLVIPPQYRSVSKRHALISYDADQRSFLLEDCWSTQGTFVQGKAIPSGEPVRLRSGERFELASAEVAFEVIHT